MMKPRRKTVFLSACTALLLSGMYYTAFRMVPDQTIGLLHLYGFTQAQLQGGTSFHGNSFAHEDIVLDKNGFSTIKAIRIQPDWFGLFGKRFVREVIIDHLALTGEWQDGTFDIAGWAPRIPPFPVQDSIILNGVQVDLETPEGSIRMETKGRLLRDGKDKYKLEGILYGAQHQLKIDSSWMGSFSRAGDYAFEGEIAEANMRLDDIELSRANGWLQIASAKDDPHQPPLLSGQLQMGRLSIADIPLGNATVTIDGQAPSLHLIIEADVAGMADMKFDADLTRQGKTWMVNSAAISTPQANDLIAFMLLMREKMDARKSNALTSFLITPGNMERLRKEIARVKYDRVALQIDGPLSSLHGSVIATESTGGRMQRHAISLDPGGVR